MFPFRGANFVCKKNTGFSNLSGHKTAVVIVSDLGWGCFGCGGGDAATVLQFLFCRRWGSVEEDKLRDSEAVEKARVMGGSGVIIGDILCLFLLRKLPILLAPLSFSPLHGRVTRK